MATIAIMLGGAVLNATSFIGGSYLAKYLSNSTHTDEEQIRHDKAIEKYQHDMGEFQKKREQYQDWLTEKYQNKIQADDNFKHTDAAFRLYAQTHPDFNLEEPHFSNYYKKSSKQKQYEMMYVGGGMLGVGYLASTFL